MSSRAFFWIASDALALSQPINQPNSMPFPQIKAILDQTIQNWTNDPNGGAGTAPDLTVHGDTFSWETNLALQKSVAFGLQLIQPEMIGKNPKMGAQTNLVMVFRTGVTLNKRVVRMPLGAPPAPADNPWISKADIQTIENWIDGGCLD
jgi:hypothetical protein